VCIAVGEVRTLEPLSAARAIRNVSVGSVEASVRLALKQLQRDAAKANKELQQQLQDIDVELVLQPIGLLTLVGTLAGLADVLPVLGASSQAPQ
jgi:hypothetical protein